MKSLDLVAENEEATHVRPTIRGDRRALPATVTVSAEVAREIDEREAERAAEHSLADPEKWSNVMDLIFNKNVIDEDIYNEVVSLIYNLKKMDLDERRLSEADLLGKRTLRYRIMEELKKFLEESRREKIKMKNAPRDRIALQEARQNILNRIQNLGQVLDRIFKSELELWNVGTN